MHGGTRELLPPGDPRRGGRPPTSFSYVQTIPDQYQHVYEWARLELGKLDHEIALARTNLFRFQQRYEEQQKGGIPTSIGAGGGSLTIRTYADVVGEYLDRIGRLEERRSRILLAGTAGASSGPRDIRWEFGRAPEVTLEDAVAQARAEDRDAG